MDNEENEIEMIYYLNILWKRKWLIILPTILCVIGVGIISFLLPPQWEIDAILQPGKFFLQSPDGTMREIIFIQPAQIASQINQESYNQRIADELNLKIENFPKLTAREVRDTDLVLISLKEDDIKRAKLILSTLLKYLKTDLDKKVEVEIKTTETKIANNENLIKDNELTIEDKSNRIKLNEIEKNKIKQQILTAENKIEISLSRENSIIEEKKTVKKRIDELELLLRNALAEKKESIDALGLLLYSNDVQNNLRYLNYLDEDIKEEKILQEDLELQIGEGKEELKKLDTQTEILKIDTEKIRTQIDSINDENNLLKEKKALIDYAQVVKEPTSSLAPISPQKMLNIFIAGILGLFVFTVLSFFLEYIQKQKAKNS